MGIRTDDLSETSEYLEIFQRQKNHRQKGQSTFGLKIHLVTKKPTKSNKNKKLFMIVNWINKIIIISNYH